MATELRNLIQQAINSLKKKRGQVNPEILDQLDKLIPLFRGMNASTVQAAALACNIKTEVNLGALTSLVQTLVDHEKIMAGEMSSISVMFLEQLLNDPSKLSELAREILAREDNGLVS